MVGYDGAASYYTHDRRHIIVKEPPVQTNLSIHYLFIIAPVVGYLITQQATPSYY
jgi:hypothetical protein